MDRMKGRVAPVLSRIRHDLRIARSLSANLAALRRAARGGREIVLFSRIGRLGDVVQCEPIVRHLRRERPSALIAYCILPRFRELIDSNPHVDLTLEVCCLCEARSIARAARVSRFVDAHPAHERWGDCRRTGGEPKEGETSADDFPRHSNRLAAFQRIAGLPVFDDRSEIHVTEEARRRVDALGLPPGFVALHCRSLDAERNWSGEGWNELAASIGRPVVELGDGHSPLAGEAVSLCGRTGILEAAEVIRRASLFVGVDSGPAHLANAVGTPGVILVGNHRRYDGGRFMSNRMYNGLYASEEWATIVRSEDLDRLSVPEVLSAVLARMERA